MDVTEVLSASVNVPSAGSSDIWNKENTLHYYSSCVLVHLQSNLFSVRYGGADLVTA